MLKNTTIFLIFTFQIQILVGYSFFLLLKKEYVHRLHLTNYNFVKINPTFPVSFSKLLSI